MVFFFSYCSRLKFLALSLKCSIEQGFFYKEIVRSLGNLNTSLRSDSLFEVFTFDKLLLKVPYPLIEWARRTDNIRVLAAWLIIKRQHPTGHIYTQQSYKSFHRNTNSKYFKMCIDLGLIVPDPYFGYRCISLKKACIKVAKNKRKFKPIIIFNSSIHNVVKQIRALVIRTCVQQQNKAISKRETVLKHTQFKRLKVSKGNAPTLSDAGAGRLICKSPSTGRKIKLWMEQQGLLKLENQEPLFVSRGGEQAWYRAVEAAKDLRRKPCYRLLNDKVYQMRAQLVWVTDTMSLQRLPFESLKCF